LPQLECGERRIVAETDRERVAEVVAEHAQVGLR
jgi:hypothetical protein